MTAKGGRISPAPRDIASVMAAMFEVDPSLGGKDLSARLGLSVSRLARVFKRDMGVSMVEYRNRLRFERLFEVLSAPAGRPPTLRDAARAAGFGSYAHFHRLFRARWDMGPRQAVRTGVAPLADDGAETEEWLQRGRARVAAGLRCSVPDKLGNS